VREIESGGGALGWKSASGVKRRVHPVAVLVLVFLVVHSFPITFAAVGALVDAAVFIIHVTYVVGVVGVVGAVRVFPRCEALIVLLFIQVHDVNDAGGTVWRGIWPGRKKWGQSRISSPPVIFFLDAFIDLLTR